MRFESEKATKYTKVKGETRREERSMMSRSGFYQCVADGKMFAAEKLKWNN